jgi:hypothetical protein
MTSRVGRLIPVLIVALVVVGCFPAPGSKAFAPEGPLEKRLFPQAKRNVFPDDVRADPAAFRTSVLLWTGIIKAVQPTQIAGGRGFRAFVEHHYWDFIEDYSIQRAIAFLSPRGEGPFEVLFAFDIPAEKVLVGDMAIVYGSPSGMADDGRRILLDGAVLRTIRRELYATDIWDYGRDWLTKQDRTDFRILRTPMR